MSIELSIASFSKLDIYFEFYILAVYQHDWFTWFSIGHIKIFDLKPLNTLSPIADPSILRHRLILIKKQGEFIKVIIAVFQTKT